MRPQLPSWLKTTFGKIPSFSRSGKHALAFLNITQFLGIINDNVFKFVMAFLLIDTLGHSEASGILSATGAIYVIPFLLFSSSAGILADKFSKQKLLVVMKVAEIALMAIAIFAFASKSVWGCYTLLFFLSTHSAMFGPSKYGIIPELVTPDHVSRANGLVTSFTYLAIIIGTFLASFLTEVTNHRFVLIAIFCLFVAIGGFFSALAVKSTTAQKSTKEVNFYFVREIYKTLKYTRTIRHLLPAIFGSSFFLLIGAFTQLNIIPFALQSLNLSEVAGGYLFLACALGIALGSFLAGKASRSKRVELGLSCLAGFGISLFFVLIALFSTSLIGVIICLIAIGILGGAFIVPFDTFTQLKSDDEKRGQTIAAANFLGFTGVLIASFALYFFNSICGLSSANSFAVIGILTLVISIVLTLNLSDMFFPYISKKILKPLLGFKFPNTTIIDRSPNTILVLEQPSWLSAIMLSGAIPNVHFLIPKGSKNSSFFHRLLDSFHLVSEESNIDEILKMAQSYIEKGITPCLILEKRLPQKLKPSTNSFLDFFTRSSTQLLYVRPCKDPDTNKPTFQFEK